MFYGEPGFTQAERPSGALPPELEVEILEEKSFNLKKSGNEVYCTNA